MEPLRTFLVSREFEKDLSERVSSLKRYGAKEELHFSDAVITSLRFRWEGKKTLAEIVLRETGDCDAETIDVRTGTFSPHRYKRCSSKEEFYEMFAELVAAISANEERA